MIRRFTSLAQGVALGAAILAAPVAGSAAPLAAVPNVTAIAETATPVRMVWQRHFGGGRFGGHFGHRGFGGVGIGLGAAILGGAIIGSAFDNGYGYGYGYGDGYYAYNDAYGGSSYCASRFRSYDPASGTYVGYDGRRHPCP